MFYNYNNYKDITGIFILCFMIISSSMYMYLDGERVTNFSILISGSLIYYNISSLLKGSILSKNNKIKKFWLYLTKNDKNIWNFLFSNLNDIKLLLLFPFKLIIIKLKIFFFNLERKNILRFYLIFLNPWYNKILRILEIDIYIELLYKQVLLLKGKLSKYFNKKLWIKIFNLIFPKNDSLIDKTIILN